MVKFFSTEQLRELIEKYLKKDEYKSCKSDICSFFKSKSINDIFSQPILVAPNKNFNFIKSRIANSSFNKGKSGGYRLYYYVDKEKCHVYLVSFYPKTGKYGREDLTDTELKIEIKKFSKEKEAGSLKEHSINDEFSVVEKKLVR